MDFFSLFLPIFSPQKLSVYERLRLWSKSLSNFNFIISRTKSTKRVDKKGLLTEIFVLLFGGLSNFLVLSLPVVGKPAGDLLSGEACFLSESNFIIFLQIGVFNII